MTLETLHLRTTIWQVVASSLPKIRMSSPGAMTATWKLWSDTGFSRQRLTTHLPLIDTRTENFDQILFWRQRLTTHLPLLDIDTRITGLHPSRGSTNHRKRIGFQKLVPTNSCWRDCTIFNVDIFGQKKRIFKIKLHNAREEVIGRYEAQLIQYLLLVQVVCVKWILYLSKSCDTGRVPSTSKPSIISTIV